MISTSAQTPRVPALPRRRFKKAQGFPCSKGPSTQVAYTIVSKPFGPNYIMFRCWKTHSGLGLDLGVREGSDRWFKASE